MTRIITLTVAAIFFAEALVMLFLASFGEGLSLPLRILLDTTLLTIFVFPTLYLLVFKEMAEQIRLRKQAEEVQGDCNHRLELIIEERTERLCRANEDLLIEVQERARAEMALRTALNEAHSGKDQMFALINAVRDALIVVDSKGQVKIVNRAAESMFRVSSYDLQGKSLQEFLLSWAEKPEELGLMFGPDRQDEPLLFMSPPTFSGDACPIQMRYGADFLWEGDASKVLMFSYREDLANKVQSTFSKP